MATGFPALLIRPPESPIQQYGEAQQIAANQQAMQLRALQIQQEQQQIRDQHALTSAMTQWDGKDYKALPMQVLKAGGSGQAAMAMTQNVLAMREKSSQIAKDDSITAQNNADTHVKDMDEARGTLLSINGLPLEQRQERWDAEVNKAEQSGLISQGQIPHQYPGEQQSTALANTFALGSKLQQEAQERQKLALDAWKPSGGQLVNALTGEKIGGISDIAPVNKGLETRWQVLHPGQPAPDYFQLKPEATPTDFDRIDKLLEATEKGTATKAQQETVNAIKAQTFELMRDKADLQAVVGIDPKTGRQVLVPLPQAQQMGIQNPIKAEGQDVQRAMAGRQWLTMAKKEAPENAPAEEKGIMQLINELDAKGQLGVLASRWNDFMARKLGSADTPEYRALATKMGLSTTLLAQAHAGARGAGSPYLLEHMEDLANAKKLDGPTLKAAFGSEVDYVEDRAMDPNPPDYSKGRGAKTTPQAKPPEGATHIVPGPDGKNHYTNAAGTQDLGIVP